MKSQILLVLFIFMSGLPCAFAELPEGVSPSDYNDLLQLVKPYTYTLSKQILVYNWHNASDQGLLNHSSQDPSAYAGVENMAQQYWGKQTDPKNTGDMFGTGLYTALDPVATRSYGGSDDKWVLTQLRLAPGFRIMDVKRDGGNTLPLDKTDLVKRLGCPDSWKNEALFSNLMNPAKSLGYPKCQAVIRKLFKDDLKIDGFAYGYMATQFKDCDAPISQADQYMKSAFVITNGDKLKPTDVHVYSRLTTDDAENRARIQTLFMKAKLSGSSYGSSYNSGPTTAQWTALLKAQGLTQYTSWLNNQQSSWGTSSNGVSSYTTMFCEKSFSTISSSSTSTSPPVATPYPCVLLSMTQGTQPNTSTVTEPDALKKEDYDAGAFLWSDLEGNTVPQNLNAWMKQNLYGCENTQAYGQAKFSASGHGDSDEGGSDDQSHSPAEDSAK